MARGIEMKKKKGGKARRGLALGGRRKRKQGSGEDLGAEEEENGAALARIELGEGRRASARLGYGEEEEIGASVEDEEEGGFVGLIEVEARGGGFDLGAFGCVEARRSSALARAKARRRGGAWRFGSEAAQLEYEAGAMGLAKLGARHRWGDLGEELERGWPRTRRRLRWLRRRQCKGSEPCPKLVPILPNEHAAEHSVENETDDKFLLNDDDVYAWKELRLHPLLIESIRRLGFREPTPIQKACIPAAAHQGKDVIGAAETGSGKTLAFGLPILQRLLEEQEKAARSVQTEGKPVKAFGEGPLRALIITPTRELALQVSDHLKAAAKNTNIGVVPIVGGISSEKQDRLLKRRPEIIVGTPGRLWELISGGNEHLAELHSLSFFVLDEADRMIEKGHFRELQSIIDMLPEAASSEQCSQSTQSCKNIPNLQRKKRQTFVFSATIALSNNFRKKLKRSSSAPKSVMAEGLSSIESLSERAGMKANAAVVDLTNAAIMADKLEESFIECREEDKEAYLYYILRVHGQGRTIVFCTSIAALRRISALLRILGINAGTLHAQMQQRARLKAIDRFRGNEHPVLIATDVAARGIDIPGIRTVVHYQLPHSAEVYIHRSGRTARASAEGCCIALISPSDKTKFISLCKSMSKESLRQFPLDDSYMPEIMKRVTLARQIDKLLRKNSQENVKKNWLERNAESMELTVEESDSEEETVHAHKLKKMSSLHLKKLQQELIDHLAQPLQPKSFSRRFLAGAGVSPVLQKQLEQLSKRKSADKVQSKERRSEFVVIGQDCVEPLQALRSSGHEVCLSLDRKREIRATAENLKRKRREEKKRSREKVRNEKKKKKQGMV